MLSFSLANRFLKHNRNQTLLVALGIAVGVTAQLFVGMLISSLQQSLINQTLGTSPHILISSTKPYLDPEDGTTGKIKALSGVTTVLTTADTNGFLIGERKTYPILFRGVSGEATTSLYDLSEKLVAGTLPAAKTEVLIGKELADSAKLTLGDRITLQNPSGTRQDYRVSGVYDLKVAAVNTTWLFSTLEAGESFGGYGAAVTGIEVQVKDPFTADVVMKDSIAPLVAGKDYVTVTNWKAQNASLLSGLQGQSSSSYMIQLFVLVSVLVGITSVLSISVLQQARQIGILKAMGLPNRTAGHVFAWQGAIIGFWGVLAGGLLGFGAFYGFALNVKNPDGTPLIAPVVQWPYVIATLLIAFIVSVLAGALSARRSVKLNPIDVIRSS